MRIGFVRSWLPVLLLLTAAAAPMDAEETEPRRIFAVTMDVEGQMMSAMIAEGSFLRLTLRETDEYHLAPAVQPGREGRVLLTVSRGPAGGKSETRRVVERLELAPGVPRALRTAPALRIVLDAVHGG